MDDKQIQTLEQVQQFVASSQTIETVVKIEPSQIVQPAVVYLRMRPITNPEPRGQARIAIKYCIDLSLILK